VLDNWPGQLFTVPAEPTPANFEPSKLCAPNS